MDIYATSLARSCICCYVCTSKCYVQYVCISMHACILFKVTPSLLFTVCTPKNYPISTKRSGLYMVFDKQASYPLLHFQKGLQVCDGHEVRLADVPVHVTSITTRGACLTAWDSHLMKRFHSSGRVASSLNRLENSSKLKVPFKSSSTSCKLNKQSYYTQLYGTAD